MTPTEKERRRCLKIIEVHFDYARSLDAGRTGDAPGAEALLIRMANQIRNGMEPKEFGEQIADEMR